MKKSLLFLICLFCFFLPFQASVAEVQSQPIKVTIDALDSDRVHMRKDPSIDSESLGLFFTGTEGFDLGAPNAEWTHIAIGAQQGYIMSKYLRSETNAQSVQSRQPMGVTHTNSWVNIRCSPDQGSEQEGILHNGDGVKILGETSSHWFYIVTEESIGYVMSEYINLLDENVVNAQSHSSLGSSSSVPSTEQNVTVTVDPQDSLDAYVSADHCSVTLIPTDETVVTCQYDSNVLRFDHRIERGTHIMSFENIVGDTATSATATLFLPKDTYHQIYLDVRNGQGTMARGFQCYAVVDGNDARLSLDFAVDNTFGYLIRLSHSECVMGISEMATDYSIKVQQISNSTLLFPTYTMPAYQAGTESYDYSCGLGSSAIKVDNLYNSNLEFVYVR